MKSQSERKPRSAYLLFASQYVLSYKGETSFTAKESLNALNYSLKFVMNFENVLVYFSKLSFFSMKYL